MHKMRDRAIRRPLHQDDSRARQVHMVTKYERGRAAEYLVMKILKALGYQVARTAGSHGKADVIAWNDNHIRFIQVKTYLQKPTSFNNLNAELLEFAKMPAPLVASKEVWVKIGNTRGWALLAKLRLETGGTDGPLMMLDEINEAGAIITGLVHNGSGNSSIPENVSDFDNIGVNTTTHDLPDTS